MFGGAQVIAVGAGKGGVGKSTVALNLALALRSHGRVGILDFDFYGPNIPAMVGIEHEGWTNEWTLARSIPSKHRLRPVERYGLQIVSAGFILGEDQPMGISQATLNLLAHQMIHGVLWPSLAYLIVDLPPGTSAVQHSLVQLLRPNLAIVVVTPQLIAHMDGRKAIQMFRLLQVPVHGAVENMADGVCPRCAESIRIYTRVPDARSVWSLGVERLATIETDFHAAPNSDSVPYFEQGNPKFVATFSRLAASVVERLPPPEPAE